MEFDHLGIVVKDIDAARSRYESIYQLTCTSPKIADEAQRVWVQFFTDRGGMRWEFIQPMDEKSPAWNALQKGGGLNHFCYRTSDMEECIAQLRKQQCMIVCPPVPGAGHDQRRIAFLVSPELGLIELVEAP